MKSERLRNIGVVIAGGALAIHGFTNIHIERQFASEQVRADELFTTQILDQIAALPKDSTKESVQAEFNRLQEVFRQNESSKIKNSQNLDTANMRRVELSQTEVRIFLDLMELFAGVALAYKGENRIVNQKK